MRYLTGCIVALAGLTALPDLFWALPGAAESRAGEPAQVAQLNPQRGDAFGVDARRLLIEQATLASRLERAMGGPDPNAVRAVDGQIVIHSGGLDRFMALYSPQGQPDCGSRAGDLAGSGTLQALVVCNLLANGKDFQGLQVKLFARLNMLSGIAEVEALPLVGGEAVVEAGGIPVDKRGSLREPAPSRTAGAPDLPPPAAPLLGRSTKSAIANYEPPIFPAITAPPEVLSVLVEIRSRLDLAQQALDNQARGDRPGRLLAAAAGVEALGLETASPGLGGELAMRRPGAVERAVVALDAGGAAGDRADTDRADADRADADRAYNVAPGERVQYQTFLQQPHRGITRLLTRQQLEPDPNALGNRLEPTVGDRYPYAILLEPTDPPLPDLTAALGDRLAPTDTQRFPFVPLGQTSFRPRLAMELEGDRLQLAQSGFDYGFMLDLGRLAGVTLDDISAGLEPDQLNLRPDLREFFLNYRVPNQLEKLLLDRRRFLSAKAGPGNLPTLLSPQAPVVVGHTYLLRTVQFDAPEALTEGRPVAPRDRRLLDDYLAMPGKDLLVLFQPVAQQPNGSYTLLWRVLGEFPMPEMTDLANYATFEQSSILAPLPSLLSGPSAGLVRGR